MPDLNLGLGITIDKDYIVPADGWLKYYVGQGANGNPNVVLNIDGINVAQIWINSVNTGIMFMVPVRKKSKVIAKTASGKASISLTFYPCKGKV